MDIHTAAHYMRSGYRITRKAWVTLAYVASDGHGIQGAFWLADGYLSKEISVSFSLQDLLANDWEIDFTNLVADTGAEVLYKEPPSDEEE